MHSCSKSKQPNSHLKVVCPHSGKCHQWGHCGQSTFHHSLNLHLLSLWGSQINSVRLQTCKTHSIQTTCCLSALGTHSSTPFHEDHPPLLPRNLSQYSFFTSNFQRNFLDIQKNWYLRVKCNTTSLSHLTALSSDRICTSTVVLCTLVANQKVIV